MNKIFLQRYISHISGLIFQVLLIQPIKFSNQLIYQYKAIIKLLSTQKSPAIQDKNALLALPLFTWMILIRTICSLISMMVQQPLQHIALVVLAQSKEATLLFVSLDATPTIFQVVVLAYNAQILYQIA